MNEDFIIIIIINNYLFTNKWFIMIVVNDIIRDVLLK